MWESIKNVIIEAYERRSMSNHTDKKEKIDKHNDEVR
jgi:hypothetical protein